MTSENASFPAPQGVVSILNGVFLGFRKYLAALIVAGVLSALIDSFTIAAIIPLISFLLQSGSGLALSGITNFFIGIFSFFRIPFTFRYLIIFIGFLILARMAVQVFFAVMRARVSSRFLGAQVKRLHALTLEASWSYIVKQKGGHLQSAILWDVRRVNTLLDTFVQLAQSGSGLLVYLLVAVSISPLITVATFIAGGVVLVFLRPLMEKTRAWSEQMRHSENDLTQLIGEHLGGFKAFKAANAVSGAIAAADAEVNRLERSFGKAMFSSSLGNTFVQPLGFLFAMVLFAFAYLTGTFEIAAFAATLYLIQKIFVYMESAQASFTVLTQSVPFAAHMLSHAAELKSAAEPFSHDGKPFAFLKAITFENVSFSYRPDAPALSEVSLAIPKGAFVGLIGPSGAGKTSIVDLLLRLFTPTSGHISVDGVFEEEIALDSWRRHIGYVPQDAFLMHASVRDNIRFYDDRVTDADIERATRAASIYDDIERLPQGFNTLVGDRGVSLSGGQRQRIALARALARRPDVLVLDEATSALDSETAKRIHEVIAGLRGTLTLVVIAHRVSSVMSADEVLVVEDGHVVERGSPVAMAADARSYLARILHLQGGRE